MNQNILHHLSLISDLHTVYAEDVSDQLASKYTSLGLIAVACVIVLKQYVFKPIQCWVPAEWPRPWVEYTNSYCWIQNTYHAAFMEAGHPGLQQRKEAEIGYYQWVPILLPLQALLVLLPHAFWRIAVSHSACDPHSIVKLALQTEGSLSQKKRHRLVTSVAGHLHKAISVSKAVRSLPSDQLAGSHLVILYLASKAIYLLSGVAHLLLMRAYLGFEELDFGWRCAADLLAGRQWQQTRSFPRVTFCDVPIKRLGQWSVRSVQCVLPTNMLNEKIYIFLWFWVVFCMALTLVYCLYWTISLGLPGLRLKFIKRLLRIVRPPCVGAADTAGRRHKAERDLLTFLQLDGVFVLQMVAARCGELTAASIFEAFQHHLEAQAPDFSLRDTLPLRYPAKSPSSSGPDTPAVKTNGRSVLDHGTET